MGRYSNGLSTLFRLMEPNQAIFVHHLRTNPHNVTQVTGILVDDDNTMCALGLGLEAFGMIRAYKDEVARPYGSTEPSFDPYRAIAETLNMPKSHVDQVYALNDDYGLTFSEIADVMEQYFRQDHLFNWSTMGPEDLYLEQRQANEVKKRQEFEKLWASFEVKYKALLKEAATAFDVELRNLQADSVFERWTGKEFFDEFISED